MSCSRYLKDLGRGVGTTEDCKVKGLRRLRVIDAESQFLGHEINSLGMYICMCINTYIICIRSPMVRHVRVYIYIYV